MTDEIIKERMLRTLKENLICEWGDDPNILREMYLEPADRFWYDSEEHHLRHIQNKCYNFLSAIRDEFEKFIEIYIVPSCENSTVSIMILDDKVMYIESRKAWKFCFESEEELVDEMYNIYLEIRGKYPPKWRTWSCWTLDEEEIYHAASEVCKKKYDELLLTEDEIQTVVDKFKDAISIGFEQWEEVLEEIIEYNIKQAEE